MALAETSTVFSFISDDMGNSVDVFVDGSGDTYNSRKREGDSPYGAGWVITGKDGHLWGYGSAGQVKAFSAHTIVLELRAVVAFFTMLRTHFPQFCTPEYTYTVHMDNQQAVRVISGELFVKTSKREAWLETTEEYNLLQELIAGMDVTFIWVKGHATSVFNGAADVIARETYRSWETTGSFEGVKRRDSIENLLISRKLITAVDFRANIGEENFVREDIFHHLTEAEREAFLAAKRAINAERKAMWLNSEKVFATFTRKVIDYDSYLVFSYSYNGKTVHLHHEENGRMPSYHAGIIALSKAVEHYLSCYDIDNVPPVTIYSNLIVPGDNLNRIARDRGAIVPPKTSDASVELGYLKKLITGINIRSVSDDKEIMEPLLNEATEFMETLIAEKHLTKELVKV